MRIKLGGNYFYLNLIFNYNICMRINHVVFLAWVPLYMLEGVGSN